MENIKVKIPSKLYAKAFQEGWLNSLLFFYKGFTYILWPGANKLQVKETAKWIYNADEFIIEQIIIGNKPLSLYQFKKNKLGL